MKMPASAAVAVHGVGDAAHAQKRMLAGAVGAVGVADAADDVDFDASSDLESPARARSCSC